MGEKLLLFSGFGNGIGTVVAGTFYRDLYFFRFEKAANFFGDHMDKVLVLLFGFCVNGCRLDFVWVHKSRNLRLL